MAWATFARHASLRFDPLRERLPTSTGHDVEQLALLDVDNGRGEDQATIGAVVHEERLVEPEGADLTEAPFVLDEGFAVVKQRIVDHVPGAAQLLGDLLDAASVLADLLGEPATRSIRRLVARERNATILLGPGPH